MKFKTFIIVAILSFSCKEEPLIPTSGCNGTTVQTLDEVQFYWVNTRLGTSFLSDEFGLMIPCNLQYIVSEPGDTGWDYMDGVWVTTSGELKFDLGNPDPSALRITNFLNGPLSESESIYVPKNISIEIIDSEYDGVKGFGYHIEYDGIKIFQDIIPGVTGFQVFKTEIQAMKIALIVGFKLKHGIGPPSITLEELDLMYIDYY